MSDDKRPLLQCLRPVNTPLLTSLTVRIRSTTNCHSGPTPNNQRRPRSRHTVYPFAQR